MNTDQENSIAAPAIESRSTENARARTQMTSELADLAHDPASSAGLSFAPHVGLSSMEDGMFVHHAGTEVVDQLRFMHDMGFRSFEDNFMKLRPLEEQRAIAREMERLDMHLATFVASFETTGPRGSTLPLDGLSFASQDPDDRRALMRMIEAAGEVGRRVNARRSTLLSGRTLESLPWEYQTTNVIENLKYAGDVAERYGLILGLEPINSREWSGTFVTTVPHAHLIVQAVNHPNVRMIYDTYHAQIETGGIIEHMDAAWDSIDYIQIADAPGRNEPGTGEMNYERILRHLKDKGYAGTVGIEHGNSKPGIEGELETLRALRRVNP
ncbi:MAG: TIM barrel protein [Pseudomonadota bacterium]